MNSADCRHGWGAECGMCDLQAMFVAKCLEASSAVEGCGAMDDRERLRESSVAYE